MAIGTESKQVIFNKMLETFEGSFMADAKTLRIPMTENGEVIEIKVTLTAAKDILGGGNASHVAASSQPAAKTESAVVFAEPTEDEKERLRKLLSEVM